MRAHYNAEGRALLARGYDSPESYDITAPDPGPERYDADDESADDTSDEPPRFGPVEAFDSLWGRVQREVAAEQLAVRRLELVTLLARVAALVPATPRKVLVVEGHEVRCAS